MVARILFVALILATQSAWAQSSQPARHIVLETRFLTLSDSLSERAGVDLKLPAPVLGTTAIRDKQQLDLILQMASGDKRSNAGPVTPVSVPTGESSEFSPFGRSPDLQGQDSILATASDDGQSINLELTWAKWKNGVERLPAMTEAVPLGSHLIICTTELSEGRLQNVSLLDKVFDRLLNRTRATAVREMEHVYVVILPRFATPEEEQQLASR